MLRFLSDGIDWIWFAPFRRLNGVVDLCDHSDVALVTSPRYG